MTEINEMVNIGDILTVDHEIINICGEILLAENQKVEVRDLFINDGHWSRLCPDIWIPPKLLGVIIVGEYGIFLPQVFKELKDLK